MSNKMIDTYFSKIEYNLLSICSNIEKNNIYSLPGNVHFSDEMTYREYLFCNCHILLALSGGSDSIALLYGLHAIQKKYHYKLACAYINHGIQSNADQVHEKNVVYDVAHKLGVKLYIDDSKMHISDIKSLHISEEEARNFRYDKLRFLARMYNFNCIAAAHHNNDFSETVCMQILDGKKLRGIPQYRILDKQWGTDKQIYVIRPCIGKTWEDGLTADQLLEICRYYNLEYHTDPSNQDTVYKRNHVRNTLFPVMKKKDENIESKLRLFADSCSETLKQYWFIHKYKSYTRLRLSRIFFESLPIQEKKQCVLEGLNYLGLDKVRDAFLNEVVGCNHVQTGHFYIGNVMLVLHAKHIVLQHSSSMLTQKSAQDKINISKYIYEGMEYSDTWSTSTIPIDIIIQFQNETSELYSNKITCRGNIYVDRLYKNDTLLLDGKKINVKSLLMRYNPVCNWNEIPVLRDDGGIVMVMGKTMLLPNFIKNCEKIKEASYAQKPQEITIMIIQDYARASLVPILNN